MAETGLRQVNCVGLVTYITDNQNLREILFQAKLKMPVCAACSTID